MLKTPIDYLDNCERSRWPSGFAQEVTKPLLCATSEFSVSLWLMNSEQKYTTETQRTQRLHREAVTSSSRGLATIIKIRSQSFLSLPNFYENKKINLATRLDTGAGCVQRFGRVRSSHQIERRCNSSCP